MATIATFAAFSSSAFKSGNRKVVPTGGNYVIDNNGAGKRVHVFTSPGYFTIPSNVPISTKFTDLEVLLVGGGGPASSHWYDFPQGTGGGGGGGAVLYDSAYRMVVGQSIYVTVGDGWGQQLSQIDGMPTAMQGGYGGNQDDYSKGWPGGSGGGGSWHNGMPNGSNYTVANPGYTYEIGRAHV